MGNQDLSDAVFFSEVRPITITPIPGGAYNKKFSPNHQTPNSFYRISTYRWNIVVSPSRAQRRTLLARTWRRWTLNERPNNPRLGRMIRIIVAFYRVFHRWRLAGAPLLDCEPVTALAFSLRSSLFLLFRRLFFVVSVFYACHGPAREREKARRLIRRRAAHSTRCGRRRAHQRATAGAPNK